MHVRLAAASLVALAWAGALFAQVATGPELTLTGHVVSTGNTSLVVRMDDGRESPPLVLTTTTQLPPGLGAGHRVTVYYHAVGDRQVADRVVAATASALPPPAVNTPAAERPGGSHGGPSAEDEWATDVAEPASGSQEPPAQPGHGTRPAEPGHGMRPADDDDASSRAPAPANASTNGARDAALPATASPLSVVGLAGVAALLGSILLRASEGMRSR